MAFAQCETVPTVTTPSNIAAITCQSNSISNNQNINNTDLGFLNGTNINDLTINNGGTAVFCNAANVQNNLNMNGSSRLHINGTSTLPNGGNYSNNAVIIVQNNGTLNSSRGNFNNATIVVRSGGTLNLNSNFENATIIIQSGGVVNLNAGAFNQNVTIVVNSGATLNINNDLNINQNSRIINFGQISTTRNITLQNTNSRIFNATNAARFTMGNLTINNGGRLVNYGAVTANELLINGGDGGQSICTGANTAISVSRIAANNLTNSVNAPSGAACFRIRGTASSQLNNALTGSTNLTMCIPTGMAASTGGAAGTNNGFGSATQVANCNDDNLCNQILPVTWVSFTGTATENEVVLLWSTAYEFNNSHFDIQRSSNGTDFITIGTVSGVGNSRTLQTYQFTDYEPLRGMAYYRIRQVDFDGMSDYSKIVTVTYFASDQLTATIAGKQLHVHIQQPTDFLQVILIDISGKVISEQRLVSLPTGQYTFDLPMHQGFYLLHINADGKKMNRKLAITP